MEGLPILATIATPQLHRRRAADAWVGIRGNHGGVPVMTVCIDVGPLMPGLGLGVTFELRG